MDDALRQLAERDPLLRQLIEQYPRPKFTPHTDYYAELVSSIIGQQLSVAAARTINGRVKALFAGSLPSPEQILTADHDDLRSAGLSRPKIAYMRDLAEKIVAGDIRFDDLDDLTNDDIILRLTTVKGIGEWTVHMFLLFCMGRLNVLPVGDLGIRNAVTRLYGLGDQASPSDVATIAQKNNWQPFESVASWYLWQSLENKP